MTAAVLDKIKTENGTLFGVVDYVSTKYVTMFILHDNDPAEVSMMMITYKTFFSYMRFSVFKSLYFPQHQIRPPVMLNKKVIKEHSRPLTQNRPNRVVNKVSATK